MLSFVLLSTALTLLAVAAVVIPLVRSGAAATTPAPWAALAAGALLVIGSAALYVSWSNWPWSAPAAADSPQQMVGRLARRMERDPANLEGWLQLGNSYVALQEYHLAIRAFEKADQLSGGKNPEALTGEAEALALTDEGELDGRAGRLIERALLLAPDSGKALFFGATTAERRGDLPLARQRFARLLALNPPDNLRPILERQMRLIDEKLAMGAAGATGAAAAAPAHKGPASAAAGDAAVVRVNVTLAPSIARVSDGAPLFVFVRDPQQAGPPLAVKRLESRFPQTVALTPADSMIPGRLFSAGQDVQVVARIARTGNPVGASGDPFGEVSYRVGRDGLASLVIDRLTP
jgi:cytochrome c-type biogenesis protein CcmH